MRARRPLKRWRYVGLFGPDLMACAAQVSIGPARQSFWALWLREGDRMRERTRLLPRARELELASGSLRIADRGIELRATFEEAGAFVARCRHGRGEVWTAKQAGLAAAVELALDGGPARRLENIRAVVDDTAGYHARVTEWRWSAGAGIDRAGRTIGWNLVSGVNDPPQGSERAIWVAGVPTEAAPVTFAADLSSLSGPDGGRLEFEPVAQRSRRDNLGLVRSEYRAPFGTFRGSLPGGLELEQGWGVMEHHRANW